MRRGWRRFAATAPSLSRPPELPSRAQEGTHSSFEYGRYGNPTTRAAEEKICALEGAEDALLSASGMNSATTLMLALVPAGGHVITTTDCYRRASCARLPPRPPPAAADARVRPPLCAAVHRRTRQFIQTFLPRMGITHTVVDPADVGALTAALAATPTSLFFSESPTNPYLRCVDIRAVSAACRSAGALCVIDSTFATPVNTRALALGADLVLHSATKYLGGHNDLLAGCVAGSAQLVAKVRAMHAVLGGVLDPHAAYLLLRGMKTLALRVERHNASALRLAAVLESHPRVARVHYPGLASHQDHAVAVRQMGGGFGGVVSFEVVGDLWDTARFIDACRLPYIAPSLGGVETLIEQPTIISYWDQGAAKRAEIGIRDNLVRLSVGVEDYDDIEADILQACAHRGGWGWGGGPGGGDPVHCRRAARLSGADKGGGALAHAAPARRLDASARAPAQAAGIAPDE